MSTTSPTPKTALQLSLRAGTLLTQLSCLLIFLLVLSGLGLKLMGLQLSVVQTGSMSPALPVNTLSVVKPVEVRSVGVGEVITFLNRNDAWVMHRVVEIVDHGDVRRFRTQGDANRTADRDLVHEKEVGGRLIGSIPHVGAALRQAQSPRAIVYLVGLQLSLLALARGARLVHARPPATFNSPNLVSSWLDG